MYNVIISSKASSDIDKIPKDIHLSIVTAFRELREDPFLGESLKRELTGRFKMKVGVYRIIYLVNEKDKKVIILAVGHRSKIYN